MIALILGKKKYKGCLYQGSGIHFHLARMKKRVRVKVLFYRDRSALKKGRSFYSISLLPVFLQKTSRIFPEPFPRQGLWLWTSFPESKENRGSKPYPEGLPALDPKERA